MRWFSHGGRRELHERQCAVLEANDAGRIPAAGASWLTRMQRPRRVCPNGQRARRNKRMGGFLVMQRRHRRHDCHRERRSMEKQPTLTSNGLSSLSLSAPYTRFRSVVECLMLLLGQLGAGALACAEKNSPEREVNEWLAAPLGR